jgi:DNA-binding CsgD family transcriptional regulator/tetratricopeptide (TPR) repeat protein
MILLERDQALLRLSALLDEARHGHGRIALIRGEAGIGKTSLTRSFVESLDDSHVLWGGCDDLLTARPLGPVWDMAFDEPSLEAALAEDDRQVAFRVLLDLVSRSMRPTVVAIEDVHWADEATLDLIKFLGRRIERTHGVLVLTYRDGEVPGDHPLRVALGDLPYGVVERIQLQPLSRESVAEIAGDRMDADTLWELTGGNPFFVSEVVAAGSEHVPFSIRDAVIARVQRLSDDARSIVELASVAPSRIELSVVSEIMGDVADAIAECEEAGILEVRGDSLSFRHELARRAVEGDLAEIERRRLNLVCLEAAEHLGLDLARLAHHAREAEDAGAIVRILPEAARRAADMESHSEAVANLRALEPHLFAMTREQLADHYDLWAYEEYLSTETGSALIEKALDIRRTLADPEALGRSLLIASRIAWVRSQRDEAIAHAEEAVEVLTPVAGEQLAMAYSTLSQLAMLANQEEEAIAYAEKALGLAGDQPSQARAHALNNIGSVQMNNHYPDGIREIEESFRIASELGLTHDQARATMNLGWGYLHVRELGPAIEWIERGMEIMNEAEMPAFESYAQTEKAVWHELQGEWDAAEEISRALLERSAVLATSRATTTMTLAKVLIRRGVPEGETWVWDAMRRGEAAGEIQRLGPSASVMVEYKWLGGEVPELQIARAIEVRDLCYRLGANWHGAELGQWLRLIGAVDDISDLSPEPYRRLAEGDWRGAAKWWDEHGIPYETAVALSFGDVEARLEALGLLDQLGAIPLAGRIRAELGTAGVRGVPRGPHRATRENPLGLTSRQTDVLQLLTEDLTNAEIADRLFISTRTVDHHVSAILMKLGATNRSEAAEKAREALTGV